MVDLFNQMRLHPSLPFPRGVAMPSQAINIMFGTQWTMIPGLASSPTP